MVSTVRQLNISETNNSIDGTDGNWTIVSGKDELYVVNNTYDKKYKLVIGERSLNKYWHDWYRFSFQP